MITKDMVVTFHYTLKDDDGNVMDQSQQGQPLAYLHGHKNIIPGLEKNLDGLNSGDKKEITVSAEQGYGNYDANLAFKVEKKHFGAEAVEPGMMAEFETPQGPLVAVITKIEEDMVFLDANHPMAGKTLHFEVEIAEIRDATQEELSHGHPHGPGGHHH